MQRSCGASIMLCLTMQRRALVEHARWPALSLDTGEGDAEVAGWEEARLDGVASLLPCGTVRVVSLDLSTILDLAPTRMCFKVRLHPRLCPSPAS